MTHYYRTAYLSLYAVLALTAAVLTAAALAEGNAPQEATHWSLRPIKRPGVPTIQNPISKIQNPIDSFILAELRESGLELSAPADRRALIRQVTVDLTGLPPTPGEVESYLSDRSDRSYENLVDRLLASPAYGERWARHWLDVVRFGESTGYEQNHLRNNAWPYRDYVIRSLNEDKPYDRFVSEQLAGDVLGKGDPNIEPATGFLVAGVHDNVGIQEEEGTRQQRANDLDDMVATTGEAFLGVTVGCAKCHNHKFDPIPQMDYYRMAACFAGVRHGERSLGSEVLTESERAELASLPSKISAANNGVQEIELAAREVVLKSRGQKPAPRAAVNARRNVDDFPPIEAKFVRFTILATRDASEPCLDELQVFGPDGSRNLALASNGARATTSSLLPGFAIHQIAHLNDGLFGNDESWISATKGSGWAQIELPKPETVRRVIWSRDADEIPRFDDRIPSAYRIEVSTDGFGWKTVSTEEGRAGSSDYVHPNALVAALTDDQTKKRAKLIAERDALNARKSALESATRAYIGQFSAPDSVYFLNRGDVMQRGEAVSPGALSRIPAISGPELVDAKLPESERRIALARWIIDPRNPLTARVIVNRLWHHHFGRGLVATPSDFGRMGVPPSHPELLDWLASELMSPTTDDRQPTTGNAIQNPKSKIQNPVPWSLKRIHRLIVTSHTYRQSSKVTPEGQAKDAGNMLLWRAPLRRMEAEAVRDSVLAVSGKLDRRMGGPGFRLFKYRVVNVAIYEPLDEFGPETWRRGIYSQNARAVKDDVLCAFDCPESSQRFPRRESTTTALQALSLLNGAFVVQQSAFFAERVRKESGPNPKDQARRAFQFAFGRSPDSAESAAAESVIMTQGLPALCRALFNANEFLYY